MILASKIFLQTKRSLCRSSDPCCVVNSGVSKRSKSFCRAIPPIMFPSVVGAISDIFLDGEPELAFTTVSFVDIKRFVLIVSHNHVLGIDGTAKELDTIVSIVIHLDIFDGSSGTNCPKGQSVDFIIGCKLIPSITNRNITENTGVVLIIDTTIEKITTGTSRETFDLPGWWVGGIVGI